MDLSTAGPSRTVRRHGSHQPKPSGWISSWRTIFEFNLNRTRSDSVQFVLDQQGSNPKSASLKLYRKDRPELVVALRKGELQLLKDALWQYPEMADTTLLVNEGDRKLELVKVNPVRGGGLELEGLSFDRKSSVRMLNYEIPRIRNLLGHIHAICAIRSATKEAEDVRPYQEVVLCQMFNHFLKEQMAKGVCRGCEDELPAQLAHSCGGASTMIDGRLIKVEFHEAVMVVMQEKHQTYETLYRKLLSFLLIPEPEQMPSNDEVLELIYTKGYFLCSTKSVNPLIRGHVISLLILNL
ncbi:hypothetical protein HDE_08671 [Halotydeus destructor]|nr:hypothetical protein HDE_08671 [Halotydeus destructor]